MTYFTINKNFLSQIYYVYDTSFLNSNLKSREDGHHAFDNQTYFSSYKVLKTAFVLFQSRPAIMDLI